VTPRNTRLRQEARVQWEQGGGRGCRSGSEGQVQQAVALGSRPSGARKNKECVEAACASHQAALGGCRKSLGVATGTRWPGGP
jgi:hypothetical protein